MASRDRETIKESLQKKGFTLKDGGDHWRFISGICKLIKCQIFSQRKKH
jgi:hypothetical protein